jgi:hypothetical protein
LLPGFSGGKKKETSSAEDQSPLDAVKMMEDFFGDQEEYQEVDMGEIDDEERPFMIIDKDTGKVYDIRDDKQLERLTD